MSRQPRVSKISGVFDPLPVRRHLQRRPVIWLLGYDDIRDVLEFFYPGWLSGVEEWSAVYIVRTIYKAPVRTKNTWPSLAIPVPRLFPHCKVTLKSPYCHVFESTPQLSIHYVMLQLYDTQITILTQTAQNDNIYHAALDMRW